MTRPSLLPNDLLLTKVGNGIDLVRVLRVENAHVHYEWRDGSIGQAALSEVGRLGETHRDYQFVTTRSDA